ncbi:hypothetical protein KV697_13775 [Sphingomonas sanguinis]|uniref:hypothetical protein n=1 Tax=Sphingomonas sanguinis TaxID=33051 RepID=UPI001C58B173|nr:hypothetical protein [Sphingomonas sanguinis]QXT34844.1 hypothetical protein KV697_13775 [Sphingomonas sanguinis]
MKKITPHVVEADLGRRHPWLQKGRTRDGDSHFAVCPYCENPIQLKGLYHRNAGGTRPYGSHVGEPVEGFAFDGADHEFCPFRYKRDRPDRNARRPRGAMGMHLVEMAVSEFDRIVLILREDLGFRFSNLFARRMLEQWFDSGGYLYTGAHLRNLPWMIAYFGPSQNLFGQPIGRNGDMAAAVRKIVPNAVISDEGRLVGGESWIRLDLQCLHHRIEAKPDGTLEERMDATVRDFTDTNVPERAPLVHRSRITFRPEAFEALVNTAPGKARRDEKLLEIAALVAGEKIGG